MKKVTTIKNYRSNIEVFYTVDNNDYSESTSFCSDEFIGGAEPVTQEDFEDELAEEGFDGESIEKIVLSANINGWLE